MEPLVNYMASLVQSDDAIGLDETNCRMLMPQEDPQVKLGDAKGKRLVAKIAEARVRAKTVFLGRCGLMEACTRHRITSLTSEYRGIAMGLKNFWQTAKAMFKVIVFQVTNL